MRHRRWLGWAICVWGLCSVSSRVARAQAQAQDESKKSCASAFESAQRLMRSGNLVEARKKLVLCGGPQCPAVMQPNCQQWLSEVEASTPTLVFQTTSATGAVLRDGRVSIDGGDWTALDGRAINVNPGEHEVVISARGYRSTTRHLIVTEGEKLRREVVTLEDLAAAPHGASSALSGQSSSTLDSKPSGVRLTVPIIVASAAAALAGGAAVYFGVRARADDRQLDDCGVHCPRDRVDQVKREYLGANISIGVAAAGLATAALLFVIDMHAERRPRTAVLGIGAGPFGIGASATGTF